VQLQEDHIFLASFFLTVQTSAIVMFSYIDAIKHNERLTWSRTPRGTPCMTKLL